MSLEDSFVVLGEPSSIFDFLWFMFPKIPSFYAFKRMEGRRLSYVRVGNYSRPNLGSFSHWTNILTFTLSRGPDYNEPDFGIQDSSYRSIQQSHQLSIIQNTSLTLIKPAPMSLHFVGLSAPTSPSTIPSSSLPSTSTSNSSAHEEDNIEVLLQRLQDITKNIIQASHLSDVQITEMHVLVEKMETVCRYGPQNITPELTIRKRNLTISEPPPGETPSPTRFFRTSIFRTSPTRSPQGIKGENKSSRASVLGNAYRRVSTSLRGKSNAGTRSTILDDDIFGPPLPSPRESTESDDPMPAVADIHIPSFPSMLVPNHDSSPCSNIGESSNAASKQHPRTPLQSNINVNAEPTNMGNSQRPLTNNVPDRVGEPYPKLAKLIHNASKAIPQETQQEDLNTSKTEFAREVVDASKELLDRLRKLDNEINQRVAEMAVCCSFAKNCRFVRGTN